jgi:hypothetical protein
MAFVLVPASAATASVVKLCIPNSEGTPTITPIHGSCPKSYTLTELGKEGPQGKQGATGATGAAGEKGENEKTARPDRPARPGPRE